MLAQSIGLLNAEALVVESDFEDAIADRGATDGAPEPTTVEEFERLAQTGVLAKDTAFSIFTSRTTGNPKASVMKHFRWLRALFWDEVIASDATAFFLPRRDLPRYVRSTRPVGNTAFINIFNVSTGIGPLALACAEYDPDRGTAVRPAGGFAGVHVDVQDSRSDRHPLPQVVEGDRVEEGTSNTVKREAAGVQAFPRIRTGIGLRTRYAAESAPTGTMDPCSPRFLGDQSPPIAP